MKLTRQSHSTVSSLAPSDVAAYLRTRGWRRAAQQPGKYSIWASGGASSSVLELFLPEDRAFADYATRMGDAISLLSEAESRTEAELISSIFAVNFDVFRLTSAAAGSVPGTVQINEGVELVQRLRDMIEAAACTEIEPRVALPPRRPDTVLNLMQRTLLGQTEVGSYVVTAQVRVEPRLQSEIFSDRPAEEEPFERRAGIRLMTAMEALRAAAEESAASGSFEPFSNAVRLGVSANLCAAVAELEDHTTSRALSLSASWAPVRPIPEATGAVAAKVEIPQSAMPFISAAAKDLRASAPLEDVEIAGFPEVLTLQRQETLYGEVVITGQIPDLGPAARKVRVKLPIDDYQQAITAQQNRRLVRVVGLLVRHGTRWHLESPRRFSVDPAPVED